MKQKRRIIQAITCGVIALVLTYIPMEAIEGVVSVETAMVQMETGTIADAYNLANHWLPILSLVVPTVVGVVVSIITYFIIKKEK